MSRIQTNQSSSNKSKIPPPPPLPPPMKTVSSDRIMPGVKIKSPPPPPPLPAPSVRPTRSGTKYGKALPPKVISREKLVTRELLRKTSSAINTSSPVPEQENWTDPEVVRNEVPFFDEETCTVPDDDHYFPCCVAPNSPRYPPNPRPQRDWDPSFLPGTTFIPTSIGRPCRRCGKLVYVAELHLSSRGAYHTECFKCCLCGKTLDSWSMSEFRGEVFCKGCYRRNFSLHGCGFGVGAGQIASPSPTTTAQQSSDQGRPWPFQKLAN